MFSQLGDKLQDIFKDLRGQGAISETNVNDAMRQVRLALLEADVHFQVAKTFIARVREKALGQEVLRSVTPGQQIVKIFHDELTTLLGGDASPLNLDKPARIMVVGLNGAGKTTSSAKLAQYLKKQGRAPVLIACDLQRPAAIEQLATLAGQVGVPMFRPEPGETDLVKVGREAAAWAAAQPGVNVADLRHCRPAGNRRAARAGTAPVARSPRAAGGSCSSPTPPTGQQAVSVATHFNDALGITGLVLTKLDGDARGGAALSMREVTRQPIKFAGVGEKLDQFEPFYPERLAGRILGMGDIVGLVEKAAEAMDEEEAKRMEEKMRTASFDFEDFLSQMRFIKKLGPLENIFAMIPGMSQMKDLPTDGKELKKAEAIVLSMTSKERRKPDLLDARRRRRIAAGSGTSVTEVNDLLQRFQQMRKMMKNMGKMKKMMGKMGGAGGLPGMPAPGRLR